jgi:hypothetical protein
LRAASGVEPAVADTPLLSVKDNPAAPKIGMALLRGEACFTRDISILLEKRDHSMQQVMLELQRAVLGAPGAARLAQIRSVK